MTGISATAVLGYKNQERYDDTGETNTIKEMVFRHVFSVGIQCPPNDELSMIKVKDFIHYLKYELGWNIAGVSCDGYQSLMLLQSLKIDGFNVKEVSMDIIKNKECVGYTIFRNTLVEHRIKLLKLTELIKEITNLEKNDATGKIDHPKQTVKILDDGTRVKSVGKDIVDSLGGAVYNATISVDVNELDFMGSEFLTDNIPTLSRSGNVADQYFNFSVGPNGAVTMTNEPQEDQDVEDAISYDIQKEIANTQNILERIKVSNPTTKLSNQQLRDMYEDLYDDGMIIF